MMLSAAKASRPERDLVKRRVVKKTSDKITKVRDFKSLVTLARVSFSLKTERGELRIRKTQVSGRSATSHAANQLGWPKVA